MSLSRCLICPFCSVFHYERRAKQLKTCHGTCLSAHFLPPTMLLWAVTYIYLHLFGYNVALKWKPSPPSVWGRLSVYLQAPAFVVLTGHIMVRPAVCVSVHIIKHKYKTGIKKWGLVVVEVRIRQAPGLELLWRCPVLKCRSPVLKVRQHAFSWQPPNKQKAISYLSIVAWVKYKMMTMVLCLSGISEILCVFSNHWARLFL